MSGEWFYAGYDARITLKINQYINIYEDFMMSQLAEVVLVSNKNEPQYLIPEHVYTHDHPDVIYYTQYFTDRATNVFVNIDETLKHNKNLISAEKIAGAWYEFSKFVPSFIANAVSLSNDPEHQHHLIQIAYDELGSQNKKGIHSQLFLDALEKADIKRRETALLFSIKYLLFSLRETLGKTKSASGIIGLLLSFEIIAENNIETVFRGLSIDSHREQILSESPFFKIHRINEIEHIRHSIANFLRFSTSPQAIKEAEEFFDFGITFWRNFWDKMSELIVHE